MKNKKVITTIDKNGIEQKEVVEVSPEIEEERPQYKAYAIVRDPKTNLFVLRVLEMSENGYVLREIDSEPDVRAVQMGKIMIELENYD
jgi:hypothetical protein